MSPEDHLYLRVLPPSQTTHFNSSLTSTSNFRLRAVYGYRITDPDCDGLCVEVPTSYSDYVYPTSPSGSSLFIDTTPAAIKIFGGLMWSNKRPNATLQGAIAHCNSLSYGGVTGWRLPTVDEMTVAYANGISGTASADWMTTSQMNDYFWAPRPNNTWGYAYLKNMANNVNGWLYILIPNAVVCVKTPPPTVTSISPNTGTPGGGTDVTITGTNFLTGATAVTIGGIAATEVTVVNATTITAVTAAGGTAGAASVLVTTPSGTSAPNTLFTRTTTSTIAAPSNFRKTETQQESEDSDGYEIIVRSYNLTWYTPSTTTNSYGTLLRYEIQMATSTQTYGIASMPPVWGWSQVTTLHVSLSQNNSVSVGSFYLPDNRTFRVRAVYGEWTTDPDCDGLCYAITRGYSDYVYAQ